MGKFIDLTNRQFGRLKVLMRTNEKYVNGAYKWMCMCSCPKKTIIYISGSRLRAGDVNSCGCITNPCNEEYLKNLNYRLVKNSKLNTENQCIEWIASKDRCGYGKVCISRNGKETETKAHRASWLVYNGKIPNDKIVCHKCDNPSCIRIEHLYLGTFKDNMQDKVKKGRHKGPRGETHHMAKISEIQAREILEMKGKGITSIEISKKYNICSSSVTGIWARRIWKHL